MNNSSTGGWDWRSLADVIESDQIALGRGNVISKIDIEDHPGDYPIYSSSASATGMFGRYGRYMFNEELITWSVDGGGKPFYRPKHKFSVTNVCGFLKIKDAKKWDYRFVAAIMREQHRTLSFDWLLKAHPSVIRDLYRLPAISLIEQRRIAEILDTLDDQIRATEQIIVKLQWTKHGLLTDLLVKGISVKSEGSIEGVLDDFVTWLSGGTPFKGSPKFWSGQVPWVTPKDMKSFVLQRTADSLTEIGVAAGSRLAPLSAVFIVVRGMILAHTFPVCQTKIASAFNQDIKAVVPGPLLEPRYLAYWFVAQSDSFLRRVGESTHGTKKLDLPDLKVFPISVPCREEQLRILCIVDAHERSIDLESAILSKLRIEKQGLMSDLLTGRVRVPIEVTS
jgi:type I restriction enzyme, S subunit